jgi:hypothetical protein
MKNGISKQENDQSLWFFPSRFAHDEHWVVFCEN